MKLGALVILALMLLATMPGVGLARIRAAKLEDLVGNSDLIVVGRVESTRLTRPATWQRVTLTASLGVFATGALLMLHRKRKTVAAVLVCIGLLGLFRVQYSVRETYSTVADLSVSRIVQGQLTDGEITIWYGGSIRCDETDLDVGQEYLLFLKRLSSGYTVSWYQFSVWTYRSGYVQRNPWAIRPPAPVSLDEVEVEIRETAGNRENPDQQEGQSDRHPGRARQISHVFRLPQLSTDSGIDRT